MQSSQHIHDVIIEADILITCTHIEYQYTQKEWTHILAIHHDGTIGPVPQGNVEHGAVLQWHRIELKCRQKSITKMNTFLPQWCWSSPLRTYDLSSVPLHEPWPVKEVSVSCTQEHCIHLIHLISFIGLVEYCVRHSQPCYRTQKSYECYTVWFSMCWP